MSGHQTIRIDARPAAAKVAGQAERRRSKRESEAVLVAALTLIATVVALYDLLQIGLALR